MSDETSEVPLREALRQELEQTKAAFHELLDSLSDDDLRLASGNSSWRVGQLMWHLAWAAGFVSRGAERSRKGKNLNLPRGILDRLNPWITRIGARGANREAIALKYDEAHAKALAALEAIGDDEWRRTARILGEERDVEYHFRMPTLHFEEHRADVLRGIGRE